MIIKKIGTKNAAPKSKARHVQDLADYISGPDAGGEGEKVEHRGAVNVLNVSHDEQVAEMVDLAEMARRAPQPVQHWIMSWREGEQPTPAQADEAVRIFLHEMEMSQHQAIYAMHRDTDNWHLHIAVNRVHPGTEKVVTVNKGFDIEVAHRAIAQIERAQGWQREANGLYVQTPDGPERARPRDDGKRPSTGARDLEERLGERSAERIAIETAAPLIRQATTWMELHERLRAVGVRFERKGSGALLLVGDQAVKASAAGRDCSMSALQKRLGNYEAQLAPGGQTEPPVPRPPEPLHPASPRWHDYSAARTAHEKQRQVRRADLATGGRAAWETLAARHRQERADIFRSSWKGRGDLLNATRSVLAARQLREKLDLRDRAKRDRLVLGKELARFPNYDEWLAAMAPELVASWRHRERRPAVIEGPSFVLPAPRDIRAFNGRIEGGSVVYIRSGERASPAFTDRGKEIDIFDTRSHDAVLASLQLSAQKWGSFVVRGDDRFKSLCVEIAAEHGLKLDNPELQEALALERQRRSREVSRKASPSPTPPPAPVRSNLEAYQRHYELLARQGGAGDVSRQDALVAVQMRLTGYPQSEIEKSIREGAPKLRPNEVRDWAEYAQRAAAFAWSVPGDREAERLAVRRAGLLAIEGRANELDKVRGLSR